MRESMIATAALVLLAVMTRRQTVTSRLTVAFAVLLALFVVFAAAPAEGQDEAAHYVKVNIDYEGAPHAYPGEQKIIATCWMQPSTRAEDGSLGATIELIPVYAPPNLLSTPRYQPLPTLELRCFYSVDTIKVWDTAEDVHAFADQRPSDYHACHRRTHRATPLILTGSLI